jgi:hypothetical protein
MRACLKSCAVFFAPIELFPQVLPPPSDTKLSVIIGNLKKLLTIVLYWNNLCKTLYKLENGAGRAAFR